MLCLQVFILRCKCTVPSEVGSLVNDLRCILSDTLPQLCGQVVQFLQNGIDLGINGGAVGHFVEDEPAVFQQSFPVGQKLTQSDDESLLQIIFIQMGRLTLVVALKLTVALPDGAAVFICGVPDLCAEDLTAIATDDLPAGLSPILPEG